MTEITEPVFNGNVKGDIEEKCTKKDTPNGWVARINEWGTEKNCTGKRLYDNMETNNSGNKLAEKQDYRGGKTPFVKKSKVTNLDQCDENQFPVQCHHLIPKNHLPTHGVCVFLAKGYDKDKNYQLTEDTYYDTDHPFNGYCLPYASPLQKWKNAKTDDEEDEVAFKLMSQTKRQLHQGNHDSQCTSGSDDTEEESGIHDETTNYLSKVNILLKVVKSGAELHTNTCEVCKPKSNKKEINPRERVVQHMYQVSGVLKHLIDADKIFVSERAFNYFLKTKIALKSP